MTIVPTGLHVLKVVRIGRRQNTSVIAVAADKSGQELRGVNGEVHRPSCSRRILQSQIIVPANISAPWAENREHLWTLAEEAEKRSDANLATLWEGHLPSALQNDQCERLASAFGQFLADYLGSAVDLSIQSADADEPTAKLFALCSAREILPSGFGDKNRFGLSMAQRMKRGFPTSHQTELLELRAAWATLCDAALNSH
ncbi:MobA/MobL family protein [Rhizobium panacihumi]|uniref:MobA/MobL family protein n=1 Tax=Rhizobium panacihumi TaxID=2008450 RepID=UPI003D792D93